MKKAFLLIVIAMLTILTACGSPSTNKDDKSSEKKNATLSIYTTVYPLSYFAERIGGKYVEVSSIYPAGSNEHTFEPTQSDMMKLADADVFFYIGLGLEGFVENAEKTLANENVKFVATSDAISDKELAVSTGHEDEVHTDTHATEEATTETTSHDEHNHGKIDPHVWLSPTLSKKLALSIKDELVAQLPEQEKTFNANYESLVSDLDALDKKFKDLSATAKTKTFFVSHAAFGYIAGSYGLEQVAVAGLNSQDEPSQKELTKIIDLANELNIHTILFEQNVSSKLAETIQTEIGAKSLVLNNLSVLTKDNIKNKEDYFSIMNQNIDTLSKALNQ